MKQFQGSALIDFYGEFARDRRSLKGESREVRPKLFLNPETIDVVRKLML